MITDRMIIFFLIHIVDHKILNIYSWLIYKKKKNTEEFHAKSAKMTLYKQILRKSKRISYIMQVEDFPFSIVIELNCFRRKCLLIQSRNDVDSGSFREVQKFHFFLLSLRVFLFWRISRFLRANWIGRQRPLVKSNNVLLAGFYIRRDLALSTNISETLSVVRF